MKTNDAIAAIDAPPIHRLHRKTWGTGQGGTCGVCELGREIVDLADRYANLPSEWTEEERLPAHGRYLAEKQANQRMRAMLGWLTRNHFVVSRYQVRKHHDHREREAKALMPKVERSGALALMTYYADAIAVGNKALRILQRRMQTEAGAKMTTAELMKIAEIGGKYAASAATLRQRGQSPLPNDAGFVPPDKDESVDLGGFMGGRRRPQRIRSGKLTVRVIDGEARPVADEGPADRERYNERAYAMGDEQMR